MASKFDIIVVGGGGAGLAAAISASNEGARVLVLEKGAMLGGATRLCVGTYTASGSVYQKKLGIKDSPAVHIADMNRAIAQFSQHDNGINVSGDPSEQDNAELREILATEASPTLDWLISLGMTFSGPVTEPPNSAARMHTILPNADALIFFLEREARRLNVEIRLGEGVDHLLLDEDRVIGVVTSRNGVQTEYRAGSAVILATGDFSSSKRWKARYKPSVTQIDGMAPNSQGDGHDFGEALGAEIRYGDVLYGPNLRFQAPAKKSFLLKFPPYTFATRLMRLALNTLPGWLLRPFMLSFLTTYLSPEPSLFREGAILVNRLGERFADELDRPNFTIAEQPGKTGFIVFDDSVAKKFTAYPNFVSTAPGVAYAYFNDYKNTRPDLYHRANTIEDLAKSIGVEPSKLVATIAKRNGDLALRSDGPPVFGSGPYHALGPVKSWIILAEGSLTVNTNHQVIRADKSVIDGLYAVGAVGQGGLLLPGHGTHLAWSFTSGLRAGRHAAVDKTSR